jgi:uncharacterized protein YbjQ (UPF0145 family)
MSDTELPPDQAPPADLPVHARERLAQMRATHFFTSDLSVNEFLLLKQVGFDPLGLVMGSSIYHIRPGGPKNQGFFAGAVGALDSVSGEVTHLTEALYHARELAMARLEEEAAALGADGVIGVRLSINMHAWGERVIEFLAVGTAVKHRAGSEGFRGPNGRPFTSDLSGQDFWTLLRSGYRPLGFVMGNCVYYVEPGEMRQAWGVQQSVELPVFTHALYDARELAIERLQAEAEAHGAEGIVGVEVEEKHHAWSSALGITEATISGELIEFFVFGNAVTRIAGPIEPLAAPFLVIPAER